MPDILEMSTKRSPCTWPIVTHKRPGSSVSPCSLSSGLGSAARRHALFAAKRVAGILVLAIPIDGERRYDRTLVPFDRRVARSRAPACRFDISLGTKRASASSVPTMEPPPDAASTQLKRIREVEAMI